MFKEIEIKDLTPSKNNYRKTFNEAALIELTASVKEKGILQPIVVRTLKKKNTFEVVAGHRRLQAAKKAGLKKMPAMVLELTDEQALEIQVVENSQREDVNPMEEAQGFERLISMGNHTADTIAIKIDKSLQYVLGRLRLVALPDEIKEKILKEEIPVTKALVLTRVRKKEDMQELVDELQYMTVSELQNSVSNCSLKLSNAVFNKKECETCPYRTGNQKTLFPDIKQKDECTDSECFHKKTLAHYEAVIKAEKEKGFEIITDVNIIKTFFRESTKNIIPIMAPGSNRDKQALHKIPKKYKSKCLNCTESRVCYLAVEERNYGNSEIHNGEICKDPKCFNDMNGIKEKKEPVIAPTEGSSGTVTLGNKAIECRGRFLIKNMPSRVELSDVLKKRIIISTLIYQYKYAECFKSFIKDFSKGKNISAYDSDVEIYKAVLKIPVKRLDEAISKITILISSHINEAVLCQMLPESKININKEIIIDKEFLNARTKGDLLKLINQLWTKKEMPKALKSLTDKNQKGVIVKAVLKEKLTGKLDKDLKKAFKI